MKIKVALASEQAKMPYKSYEWDAGYDLMTPAEVVVPARGSAVVDTQVIMNIPEGYVGFLKSKSGLNVKHSITSEGVIDAGYTGTIVVKLYNHSDVPYTFKAGDKITQIVIFAIPRTETELVPEEKIKGSQRGKNGFGSTGK